MSIEPDPQTLQDLDVALRRIVGELEDGSFRRRLATERARDRWRGGERQRFDERSADLDLLTSRTVAELTALRRTVRSLLDGAA